MDLTIDEVLKKGIEAHKGGRVQEADKFYTAILQAQPQHPDANHNMGVLALGIGKVEEALPFFKKALEANDTIAQFWLSYLDALIKLNRSKEAQEILLQAKEKGMKEEAFDQIETRMASFTEIPAQDPPKDQLQSLINLYSQGQYQEVLNQSAQLLRTFPQSPSLFNIRGIVNASLKNYDEAIENYQKAIKLKPNWADAYLNLGNAQRDFGYLIKAIESFQKAIQVKPDFAKAYYNIGLSMSQKGDIEKAIKNYHQCLELKNDFPLESNSAIVGLF